MVEIDEALRRRATVHGALAEPARLTIIDSLAVGDLSPSDLQVRLGMSSNLLTHHLGVLERAGMVRRSRSQGDRRRIYLSLVPAAFDCLLPMPMRRAHRVVFLCTRNSARSQLARALWTQRSAVPAESAGTRPARRVNPRAVAAARRHDLPMDPTAPRRFDEVVQPDDLVVTVCDSAREECAAGRSWVHWSIADPARSGDDAAFDRALDELARRVDRLAPTIHSTDIGDSADADISSR